MNVRLTALAAALVACVAPTWAATPNVDIYGSISIEPLPTHETYAAAADVATDFLTGGIYVPHAAITTTAGEVASISVSDPIIASIPNYTASASTTLGSNHAYASANTFPLSTLGAGSFSGWYDQVTITGGTGTGTVQFTTRLSGTVDVGQFVGAAAYGLYASTLHPTQLIDTLGIVDPVSLPTRPWALEGPVGGWYGIPELTAIAGYTVGASPYNDPTVLFTTTPPSPLPETGVIGLPSEPPKSFANLVLTPGVGQAVDVVLSGTLNFTYGEAFYLIGALAAGASEGQTFCAFDIGDSCTPPPKDGTGATTLDFSNSADLINIALPQGATASFASGATYSVTTVPEPGEWLMLLAGLGLVGWRVRSKAA